MIGKIIVKLSKWIRFVKYKNCSNNSNISGDCQSFQPVVLRGEGKIKFGKNVKFGVEDSPFFHNTYTYLEARTENSVISFGNNIHINNAFSIVSEERVDIGDKTFIGYNCNIVDSNFHDLNPNKRNQKDPEPESVSIGNNVFIGNDVTILKGVTLGNNVVVAACSVVTKSFPDNVIIGGNPAKLIRGI